MKNLHRRLLNVCYVCGRVELLCNCGNIKWGQYHYKDIYSSFHEFLIDQIKVELHILKKKIRSNWRGMWTK